MSLKERIKALGKNLAGPFIEGQALAQARMRGRKETVIVESVTFFHSPEFYNPTQMRLQLDASAGSGILSQRGQVVLAAALSNLEMRTEERRELAVEQFLSHIPDIERKKAVHLQALERALFEWRKQSGGQEPTVDQETYRSNIDRLLDEINQLKARS